MGKAIAVLLGAIEKKSGDHHSCKMHESINTCPSNQDADNSPSRLSPYASYTFRWPRLHLAHEVFPTSDTEFSMKSSASLLENVVWVPGRDVKRRFQEPN